jgi:quercetin dioxygenase-like cupin family protein
MRGMLGTCAVIVAAGAFTIVGPRVISAQGDPQKKPTPAEAKKGAAGAHVMLDAAQLKWGPAPPGLPAGATVAVLDGDPGKAGQFSLRVKVPDGYVVPPHWHPSTENLVVLSGTLMMGVGDKLDESSMHALGAGAYSKMPGKTNHYVRAKGETMFQIYGVGPFGINYVDPKDDPRKKTNP